MKPKGAKGPPILMILILILLLRLRLLRRIKSMIMSMSDSINRFAFHEANTADVNSLWPEES